MQLHRGVAAALLPLALNLLIQPITLAQVAGSNKHQSLPANLNLGSTVASQTARIPHAVTIRQGGVLDVIRNGEAITPAEQVAISQVLSSGHQSLRLNGLGQATGGSFSIGSALEQIGIGDLVVPKEVTALDGLANLPANIVLNSGNIYALPNGSSTDVISASTIQNAGTGVISTIVPSTFGNFGHSATSLSLLSTSNILNSGMITSSGSLLLCSGGAISNIQDGLNPHTIPRIEATGNLSLYSQTGTFSNSGLIASDLGKVTIAADVQSAIHIDNSGGKISAPNGAINIGTPDSKSNIELNGGQMSAQIVNFTTGTGNVQVNVSSVQGVVNVDACSAHVATDGGNLQLGSMKLSGDPTFYNTGGDVEISSDLQFSGQDLAIVASGNVIAAPGAGVISTASQTGNGGNIFIASGANVSSAGAAASSGPDASTIITISGPSATGGKIDFSSNLTKIDSSSSATNGSGGNITMVAFAGSNADSGTINVAAPITTGGNGTGLNGSVTTIAGSTSKGAIYITSVDTTGGTPGTGTINLSNATPSVGTLAPFTIQNGTVASGNITPGQLQPGTVTLGNINAAGDILISTAGSAAISDGSAVASSGNVLVQASNVSIGNGSLLSTTNPQSSISIEQTSGDLTITSQGSVQAAGGTINIGNPNLTDDVNTTITGGSWLSDTLNIRSGAGIINAHIGEVTGVINVYANDFQLIAASDVVHLGTQQVHDPLVEQITDNVNVLLIECSVDTTEYSSLQLGPLGDGGHFVSECNIVSNGVPIGLGTSDGGTIDMQAYSITVVGADVGIQTTVSPGAVGGTIRVGDVSANNVEITAGSQGFQVGPGYGNEATGGGITTGAITASQSITLNSASDSGVTTGHLTAPGVSGQLLFGNLTTGQIDSPQVFITAVHGAISTGAIRAGSVTLNQNSSTPMTLGGNIGPISIVGTDQGFISLSNKGAGGIVITQDLSNTGASLLSFSADNSTVSVLVGTISVLPFQYRTGGTSGGEIDFSAHQLVFAGATAVHADGTTNGSGGFISIAADLISVNGQLTLTANGSGTGSGGGLFLGGDFQNTLTITGTGSISGHFDGGSAGGTGGSIDFEGSGTTIVANTVPPTTAAVSMTADGGGTGNGGQIFFGSPLSGASFSGGDGTPAYVNFSARGGPAGGNGGSVTMRTGTDAILVSNIDVSAVAGTGGTIDLEAGVDGSGNGIFSLIGSLRADGGGSGPNAGGGLITLIAPTFSFEPNSSGLQISANGAGTNSGGSISITSTVSSLSIGTSGMIIQANGGSSGGDGGYLNISSAADLFIDCTNVSVLPGGGNGNGGQIIFSAKGNLNITGSGLSASGSGTGVGGSISLTAGSISGDIESIVANGSTGGSINIQANSSDGINLSNALISVASNITGSGNGNAGTLSISSAGPVQIGGNIDASTYGDSGNAGTIDINSNQTINLGGQEIMADARGVGEAGIVTIDSTGGDVNVTGSFSASQFGSSGDAGFITIDAPNGSSIINGGIHVDTYGQGRPGGIMVDPGAGSVDIVRGDESADFKAISIALGPGAGAWIVHRTSGSIFVGNLSAQGVPGTHGGTIFLEAGGDIFAESMNVSCTASNSTAGGFAGSVTVLANQSGTGSDPFVIGPSATINGIRGQITVTGATSFSSTLAGVLAGGTTQFCVIQDRGSGGITVAQPNLISVQTTTDNNNAVLVLSAPHGTLSVAGNLSMNGAPANGGSGYGAGYIALDAMQIVFSKNASVTADASGTGLAGRIDISTDQITAQSLTVSTNGTPAYLQGLIAIRPSGNYNLAVFAIGSNSAESFISELHGTLNNDVQTGSFTLQSPSAVTFRSHGSDGGIVGIEAASANFQTGLTTFNTSTTAMNGNGGIIQILTNQFSTTAHISLISNGAGAGIAGGVDLEATGSPIDVGSAPGANVSVSAIGGTVTLFGLPTQTNIKIEAGGALTVDASGIVARSNGTNTGDYVVLASGTNLSISGTLAANSTSGVGGRIVLTGDTLDFSGLTAVRANGGTSGGSIFINCNGEQPLSIQNGIIQAKGIGTTAQAGTINISVASGQIDIGSTATLDVTTQGTGNSGGDVALSAPGDFTITVDGAVKTNGPGGYGRLKFIGDQQAFNLNGGGTIAARIWVEAQSIDIINANASGNLDLDFVKATNGLVFVSAQGGNSKISLDSATSSVTGDGIQLMASTIDVSETGAFINAKKEVELVTNSSSNGNIFLGATIGSLNGDVITVSTHGAGKILQIGEGSITTQGASSQLILTTETGSIGAVANPILVEVDSMTLESQATTAVPISVHAFGDRMTVHDSNVGMGNVSLDCDTCSINIGTGGIQANSIDLTVHSSGDINIGGQLISTADITLQPGAELGSISYAPIVSAMEATTHVTMIVSNGTIGSGQNPVQFSAPTLTVSNSNGSVFLSAITDTNIPEATVSNGNLSITSQGSISTGTKGLLVPNGLVDLDAFNLGTSSSSRLLIQAQQLRFQASGNAYIKTISSIAILSSSASSIDILGYGQSLQLKIPIFAVLQATAGNVDLHVNSGLSSILISGELVASANIRVYSGTAGTQPTITPNTYQVGTATVTVTGSGVHAPLNFSGIFVDGSVELDSGSGTILLEPQCTKLLGATLKAGILSPISFTSNPNESVGPTSGEFLLFSDQTASKNNIFLNVATGC